jgi:hypothetical protein
VGIRSREQWREDQAEKLIFVLNWHLYWLHRKRTLASLLKNLTFTALRQSISDHIEKVVDPRQPGKVNYSLNNVFMTGLSCMYFQEPSFATFQRNLEEERNVNNLRTLFGIENLPSDTQVRDIIDYHSPTILSPIFKDFFSRLQRSKKLLDYEFLPGKYLCALDGTQFFSSNAVSCDQCLTKHEDNENKATRYQHQALQGAFVHPDCKQVIPVMPEPIENTDGKTKQDCEINAAKRFIPRLRETHPKLGVIMLGDSLYSKQPYIELLQQNKMSYILIAKPGDHKGLMEWLNAYPELNKDRYTDLKGNIHEYEWMNDVPLNNRKDAVRVNYFHYKIMKLQASGEYKVTYKSSWVTDIGINIHNVKLLVKGGRCRWHIENQCFNTLKNQGYVLEHNFGHGKKNLSFNFYVLTLIAFYMHQIIEMCDKAYQACRKRWGSKQQLWEKLRQAVDWFIFDCWEHLLDFVLDAKPYLDASIDQASFSMKSRAP